MNDLPREGEEQLVDSVIDIVLGEGTEISLCQVFCLVAEDVKPTSVDLDDVILSLDVFSDLQMTEGDIADEANQTLIGENDVFVADERKSIIHEFSSICTANDEGIVMQLKYLLSEDIQEIEIFRENKNQRISITECNPPFLCLEFQGDMVILN
jgi:hypothetical protein